MQNGTGSYQASDIKVLKGLEAVRMRPGMYIGSTGSRGLHHLIWEIVDNAIDEASNGFADEISVTLKKDGSCEVSDNGRGIPVDIHPELKISAVEVVYTQLHAGGKFDDKSYAYSGGLHGVGASVVNALSLWLQVDVYENFCHYRQRYESVEDKGSGKIDPGKPTGPLEKLGNTRRRGTVVTFLPDPRVARAVMRRGSAPGRYSASRPDFRSFRAAATSQSCVSRSWRATRSSGGASAAPRRAPISPSRRGRGSMPSQAQRRRWCAA